MPSSKQPVLLFELLKTEVEEIKIKNVAAEFFVRKVPFQAILDPVEQTLKELQKNSAALGNIADQDLRKAFLKVKRTIWELKKWLELNLRAYRRVHSTLSSDVDERYQKILQALDALLENLDTVYLQKVLSAPQPPHDFLKHALKGYEKIAAFFSQVKLEIPQDKQILKQVIELFLEQKQRYLKEVCHYAEAHFAEWEKLCLQEGRGLYIQAEELPFPLIYSLKGRLYIAMEIAGLFLGSGRGKLSTRCIELTEGQVYALIKPRSTSVEETTEELKKQQAEWNFFDAWKESEFLIALEGCRGVLQLQDRFAFVREEKKQLYLIETIYPDATLYHHLIEAIEQPEKRLDLRVKLRLAHDLLHGLKSIHAKGIVHHDIKWDNILLSLAKGQEEAVIADFNLAFFQEDQLAKRLAQSVAHWTAPEIAYYHCHPEAPAEEALRFRTPALDVWSLGLLLYILFDYVYPPWWNIEATNESISELKEGWVPQHQDTAFLYPLFNAMLQPSPQKRCSATEALNLFEQMTKGNGHDLS